MKEKNIPLSVCKWALLVLILFFLLFPLYWVLVTSFKTNMEAYRATPTFFPDAPTVESYIKLFTENNDFFVYYKNNFILPGDTALNTTCLASLAGHGLGRFHFKWIGIVVAILLSSQMFPVVSRMISLYDLMNKMNLINTLPGLILALTAAMLPFTVMLMSSFFDSVPNAVEEAAYVDGASRLAVLWRIVVPLVKPGMLAVAIYSFLMTWDDYLHCITLIQNDALRTMSAGVAMRYLGELSYDWSLINTISIIGTVPMLLLFFFFQKYMVKGLVAGAVKG